MIQIKLRESQSTAAGTFDTDAIENSGRFLGLKIYIDITVLTGTLTVSLQSFDKTSGKFVTIPGATTTALSAVAITTLTVHPALTTVANQGISDVLPDIWRVRAVVATGPITFSLGGCMFDQGTT